MSLDLKQKLDQFVKDIPLIRRSFDGFQQTFLERRNNFFREAMVKELEGYSRFMAQRVEKIIKPDTIKKMYIYFYKDNKGYNIFPMPESHAYPKMFRMEHGEFKRLIEVSVESAKNGELDMYLFSKIELLVYELAERHHKKNEERMQSPVSLEEPAENSYEWEPINKPSDL